MPEDIKVGADTGENTEVGASGENPNADSGKKEESKAFTQAELDAIVADRLAREKKKQEKYADYDDVKKKLAEYEADLEAKKLAELSEVERANKVAQDKETEAETLRKELEDLRTSLQRREIEGAFEKAAAKANIPEKYLADAKLLVGLSAIENAEGIDEVVKQLVKDKPFLVDKPQQRPIGDATNSKQQDSVQKSAEVLLKEAAEKARKTGRMEDKLAYVELKAKLQQ